MIKFLAKTGPLLSWALGARTIASQTVSNFSQWHLVSAVCLERKPVIIQDLTPIEKHHFEYIQQLETEKSYLSDHEIRHIEDIKRMERWKRGEIDDNISKQTAQDFQDAAINELRSFNPAPRITEADVCNDQKSIARKLDRTLLLVVKQKLGNDFRWLLPQTIHIDGETLRETAERALKETCDEQMKVQFMGNSPVGFYKYKYPKIDKSRGENGVLGAKVFFFKAVLKSKDLNSDFFIKTKKSDIIDYLWLTRAELVDVLQTVYCKAVEAILLPDEVQDVDEECKHTQSLAT